MSLQLVPNPTAPAAPPGDPADALAVLFSTRVVHADGSTIVVELAGELDAAAAADARAALTDVLGLGPVSVELDLRRLSFIDAGGLGALLNVARAAREAGVELRATGARRGVLRVLALTRIDGILGLAADDGPSALAG